MTHTVLITGANGFLGAYAAIELLARPDVRLALLVRARSRREALEKLWANWQLHVDVAQFEALLPRVDLLFGDLHAPGLGLSAEHRARAVDTVDSVLHVAASLNRKSSKACFNTNLRGTLSMIQLAREIHAQRPLSRFSDVSTVAVSGERSHEVVDEDTAIDWDRSDYDPYGRTKKFAEHMVHELLADVPRTVFRPSIVMGDSRHERTTQFDMVRAFCILADLPAIPLDPDTRLDIVPADFVGRALATLHLAPQAAPARTYHLSAGRRSPTAAQIGEAIAAVSGRTPRFVPQLGGTFDAAVRVMNRAPRGTVVAGVGALLKVFWPYIVYDTVFDNGKVCEALDEVPPSFTRYGGPLYLWSKQQGFRFPALPLPEGVV